MATRTIPAVTETTDDFTGRTLTADDKPVKVEFTVKVDGKPVNGTKPYTMDAAHAMADIVTRFLANPTDENRRALGSVIPRQPIARTGSATKDADKAGMTKRDWARANGFKKADGSEIGDRGNFPADANTAWEKHLADEAAGA